MFDDLNTPEDGRPLDGAGGVPGDRARVPASRPLSDREVPIGRRTTPAVVQAWLDGEVPEAAARRGDTVRDVELWKRITAEAERRRHVRTPAHVQEAIMAALPLNAPTVITPWYRREFVVTPRKAMAAAGALVAAGAAVAAAVARLIH
jgi:hypothetical protein